uniref:Uncharacterized protein n=1 Tax=Lates calcarifer TaxID=8187 RepID=A0A4W6DFG3_LATCA
MRLELALCSLLLCLKCTSLHIWITIRSSMPPPPPVRADEQYHGIQKEQADVFLCGSCANLIHFLKTLSFAFGKHCFSCNLPSGSAAGVTSLDSYNPLDLNVGRAAVIQVRCDMKPIPVHSHDGRTSDVAHSRNTHSVVSWMTAVAGVCASCLLNTLNCYIRMMQSGCNGAKMIKEEIITSKYFIEGWRKIASDEGGRAFFTGAVSHTHTHKHTH